MLAFARGCTGQISGSRDATSLSIASASRSAGSRVDVRRAVQGDDAEVAIAGQRNRPPDPRWRACRSARSPARGGATANRSSRCRRSGRARDRCLRARDSPAAMRSVVYSRSAIWSVSTRLISSGMLRSKLRSPASTWTTGIRFLLATRLQASVELTSPTTITQLGSTSSSTGSKRRMISAVCTACVPEPTSRFKSGAGNSRSANSRSFIATS